MRNLLAEAQTQPQASSAEDLRRSRLSDAHPGDRGVIVEVRSGGDDARRSLEADELLRRLLEFGFVEGARVEVLHEGAIGRDPIAVKMDDMRVALRRRDAEGVWIVLDRAANV